MLIMFKHFEQNERTSDIVRTAGSRVNATEIKESSIAGITSSAAVSALLHGQQAADTHSHQQTLGLCREGGEVPYIL